MALHSLLLPQHGLPLQVCGGGTLFVHLRLRSQTLLLLLRHVRRRD